MLYGLGIHAGTLYEELNRDLPCRAHEGNAAET